MRRVRSEDSLADGTTTPSKAVIRQHACVNMKGRTKTSDVLRLRVVERVWTITRNDRQVRGCVQRRVDDQVMCFSSEEEQREKNSQIVEVGS